MARRGREIIEAAVAILVMVAEEGIRHGTGWLIRRWRRRKGKVH